MTEKHSGSHEIVDRYLANRLGAKEREMVETRIVQDADFRNEVELTAALRDGLRQLQEQGQVQPLLESRSGMWGRIPIAIAASLLAGAVGLAIFLSDGPRGTSPQPPASEILRFVQTRGGDGVPDRVWRQGSAPIRLALHFDVGLEPAAEYRIVVDRAAGAGQVPVIELRTGPTGAGEVAISVDSALLPPGDYRIRLEPNSPGVVQVPTVYTLRVTD